MIDEKPADTQLNAVDKALKSLNDRKKWAWRFFFAAVAVGMLGSTFEIVSSIPLSLALGVISAANGFSYRFGIIEYALFGVSTRLENIEKLAGVEYSMNEESGDSEMRFRGKLMTPIDIEDLAVIMRQTPLDIGEDNAHAGDT